MMTTKATVADRFARFATDSAGLERALRLGESVALVLVSFPLALAGVLATLSLMTTNGVPSNEHARLIASEMQFRFGLGRRFFRMFRWFECFHSAHGLFLRLSQDNNPPQKGSKNTAKASFYTQVQPWVDLVGRTCNGMWFLLDASTLVDAFRIEGLHLWGPTMQRVVTVEAQRFWLFALACSVISGLLKMMISVTEAHTRSATKDATKGSSVHTNNNEKMAAEIEGKVETLKGANEDPASKALGNSDQEFNALRRMTIANALDIIIPGSIVGWIRPEPGIVGIVMLITTILTGMDVWERCGKEVAKG